MTKWISTKERLPKRGVTVRCLHSDGRTDDLFLCNHCGKEWRDTIIGSSTLAVITHWQPLPEPPTEEPEVKGGM